MKFWLIYPLCFLSLHSYGQYAEQLTPKVGIRTGAECTEKYMSLITSKKVALVANQTSQIHGVHLIDTLLARGIQVVKVFAPEHGFRGDSGAGETIKDGKDQTTGIPLLSLYGKTKKPDSTMLEGVEILVFDIQDVGARFYTYISTMHYVMEAAAENKIPVILLDRPNPNGFYIDGPVLDSKYQSFVGMHPIPIVHGCTIGELAKMINGEGWLANKLKCDLTVISCDNYNHSDLYELPVQPSPNLPNMSSVYLYPSLCLFEGTIVSVGRGTKLPFQSIGFPGNKTGTFSFTPQDIPGIAINPPHKGQLCTGHNLAEFGSFYFSTSRQLYLEWLTGLYAYDSNKKAFFSSPEFFDKLAGNSTLRQQIEAGMSPKDIHDSWQDDLQKYRVMRKKYLLYPDFN